MDFSNANMAGFIKKEAIKDDMAFKIISPEPKIKESDRYKDKNGNPTKQYIWSTWCDGAEYSLPLNWTSIKNITEVYGGESSDWVGKWIIAKNNFDMAKKKNFVYFFPVDKSQNQKFDEMFKAKSGVNPVEGTVKAEEIAWTE